MASAAIAKEETAGGYLDAAQMMEWVHGVMKVLEQQNIR